MGFSYSRPWSAILTRVVALQRVIPGDIDAPHNPRLGALYLNLAEYASAGAITRRYLLLQSKTNATLKVSQAGRHLGYYIKDLSFS